MFTTLHFVHSDCYELFHIQQRLNASQQQTTNTSIIDSASGDMANLLTNSTSPTPALINTSMISSAMFGNNGLNPSTTPLLAQVTDKEYCQAKKPNNRVKPWKPSLSSSSSSST